MDLTPKQQASEAIRQAETILVVTGQRPSIDQATAVLSLAMILRKIGKKVTALVSDGMPPSISFLASDQVDKNLAGMRDFIIKVDLRRAEVDKIKYTIEDAKLNVFVTPFKGGFSSSDVSFDYGAYHYDLVIALGVPGKSKLDRVFEQNPRLLSDVPLLNLDFHRINENYGAVNLIEPTASSLSEMLVALAESLQNGLIDEPIATALLTGIIASTDRFTAAHTTPKALTVAAQLMAAGGKQQLIVKSLYKTGGGQGGGSGQREAQARPPERPAAPAPAAAQPFRPEPSKPELVEAIVAAAVTPAVPTPPPIQQVTTGPPAPSGEANKPEPAAISWDNPDKVGQNPLEERSESKDSSGPDIRQPDQSDGGQPASARYSANLNPDQ